MSDKDNFLPLLGEDAEAIELHKGETLFKKGDKAIAVYVVKSGTLEIFDGAVVYETLGPGDIVGEMSFLDSGLPSATVVADEDSWILAIPRDQVTGRLHDDQGFAARFYHAIAMFLSLRLRDTSAHLGYGKVRLAEEDSDEIPDEILDKLAIAGHRFAILQERARSVSTG